MVYMKASEILLIRCPRLGGEAPLTYCLQEAWDLPCQRIVFCWQTFFSVEECLRKALSPQKWEKFTNRKPQEKISSIIELIEQAKR